jgi:NAD(P)-dependent dehydrogenase (short-subunit alcohol dehydrogenase family)
VITGASAGIGRATALRLADLGFDVALLARDSDGLEAVRVAAETRGVRAIALPCDVAHPDEVDKAADEAAAQLGGIDVWINNAMVTVLSPFHQMTAEEFRRATDVTYHGTVYGTLSALRRMIPRDSGTIIQVGSALAYRGIPLQSAYCGAKHAMKGFTESLRCELLHDKRNIHLCMVHLPAMNTPQFSWCKTRMKGHPQPVPPVYQPEIAAEAVYYASRNKRREILVGYPTVMTVQGNKLLPALGDHYLARNGYESQQLEDPVHPNRPDNLFTPAPGDYGAHGIFDDQAKSWSPQTAATLNRGWVAAAGAAAGVAAILAGIWRRR